MAVSTVHLLRHGEVFNPDKVLYGRLPGFKLSERGEQMAVQAADFLRGRDITYLVSSPLERALQTAAPIAEITGLTVDIDERLIEADNQFQGKQVAGGQGVFKDPRNWRLVVNPFRPSWGEPYAEIADRMLAAAQAAALAADGHEAVCVSHQLPIVSIRRLVEGRKLWHDPRQRQCSLASITSLTFDGDVVIGLTYSEPAGKTPPGAVAGA
jgi:broad specificity phosphatase PhoE